MILLVELLFHQNTTCHQILNQLIQLPFLLPVVTGAPSDSRTRCMVFSFNTSGAEEKELT